MDEAEEDTAHKNVVTARPLIYTGGLAQQRFRKESTAIKVCACARAVVSVRTRQRRRQSFYSRNADDVLGPLTLLASSSFVLMVLHADKAWGLRAKERERDANSRSSRAAI